MILWCCSECFFIGEAGAAYSSCPNGCKEDEKKRTISDNDDNIIKDTRVKLIALKESGFTYKQAVEELNICSHWGIPE